MDSTPTEFSISLPSDEIHVMLNAMELNHHIFTMTKQSDKNYYLFEAKLSKLEIFCLGQAFENCRTPLKPLTS